MSYGAQRLLSPPASHKRALCVRHVDADVFVTLSCYDAAARRTFNKTQLHEVRFVHLLDRIFLFRERGSDGFEADGTAVELLYNNGKYIAIGLIQPTLINF